VIFQLKIAGTALLISAFRRRVSGTGLFSGLTHKLVWSKATEMGLGRFAESLRKALCAALCSLWQKNQWEFIPKGSVLIYAIGIRG